MNLTAHRKSIYELLEDPHNKSKTRRVIDLVLIGVICISVAAVIFETVDSIYNAHRQLFFAIEVVCVMIFTVEYIMRMWVCVEGEPNKAPLRARINYFFRPLSLIDLIAILPFYLPFFIGVDLRFLRVLRILRILKLNHYFSAMKLLLDVLKQEANALFAGFFLMIVLLILSASGAYLVEQHAQPEKFGSIPDAMWWAIATLSTVGYGDVTPVTPAGKFFAACITIIGMGIVALPAGIMAGGFAEHFRSRREKLGKLYLEALEDSHIDEEETQQLETLRKNLGLSKAVANEVFEEYQKRRNLVHGHRCPHCNGELAWPEDQN